MTDPQIALLVVGGATYFTGALLAAEWQRRDNDDTHMWTPDKQKPSVFWSAVTWPIWCGGTLVLLAVAGMLDVPERSNSTCAQSRRHLG